MATKKRPTITNEELEFLGETYQQIKRQKVLAKFYPTFEDFVNVYNLDMKAIRKGEQ